MPSKLTTTSDAQPVLFLSLDLVNSTRFKAIDDSWPRVLQYFYEVARREMKSEVPSIVLWKYAGDEVLFYLRPTSADQLSEAVRRAFLVQLKVIGQIHNSVVATRNVLALKSAAWLALCAVAIEGAPPDPIPSVKGRDLVVTVRDVEVGTPGQIDFVGPDVDAGFRVAKYSQRGFMTLSANLAHYLEQFGAGNWSDRTRIVSYERLKGVWDDRLYPITWCGREGVDWQNLRAEFPYDAPLEDEWLGHVCSKDPLDGLNRIGSVMQETGHGEDATSIHEAIQSPPEKFLLGETQLNPEKLAEVHCVAVCVCDGKVLIAKRDRQRAFLAGLWEFGCAQLRVDEHFPECICEHYRADFGVEIAGVWPDPIRTYSILKADRVIPGLIFSARVVRPDDAQPVEGKHSEIRWASPDEIEALEDSECVEDLKGSARAALAVFTGQPPELRPDVQPRT